MSEQIVAVQLNLPKLTYRMVAQIASRRGVNAHTLIEEWLVQCLRLPQEPLDGDGTPLPGELISQIASFNRLGLTDLDISKKLNITVQTVTKHRQAMKLPNKWTWTKNERNYR